ncbi:MAG TPA: ABC transporter ATP-binding protein [Gemmatimonadaceae bacterium]|nr:ABC transporter ATP-binding protein [Gemmatimonadaceae bacterium]
MDIVIQMRGIMKSYRAGIPGCMASVAVLRGVDLDVREGECTAVLGAPGSGKSTLLLCAAGLLRPDCGRIHWFGRRKPGPPPPGIAFAGEHSAHYGFLTVRESLSCYATLRDLPGGHARVDEAIERSALASVARCRVSLLAPGALRRLGIAQALLGAPRVLLLDEPLAGLDAGGSGEVRGIIGTMIARGITVLLSSRELASVVPLATRVLALAGGRVRGELPSGAFRAGVPAADRPLTGAGAVAEHVS